MPKNLSGGSTPGVLRTNRIILTLSEIQRPAIAEPLAGWDSDFIDDVNQELKLPTTRKALMHSSRLFSTADRSRPLQSYRVYSALTCPIKFLALQAPTALFQPVRHMAPQWLVEFPQYGYAAEAAKPSRSANINFFGGLAISTHSRQIQTKTLAVSHEGVVAG